MLQNVMQFGLPGRRFGLLLLIVIFISMEYVRRQAVKGKYPSIKHIPAVDAMEEVVGRASEMGGKIHVGIGDFARIHTQYAPQIVAALAISGHVARACARIGVPIIATTMYGETLPLLDQTIEEAYRIENKLDEFNRDNIRFVAGSQLPYCAGCFDLMMHENIKGQILTGPWAFAAVLMGEFGHQAGLMQIGGTARTVMMPGFVALYDYFLVGEELFAAAALVSGAPEQIADIATQDYFKVVVVILLLLGLVISLSGSSMLLDVLKL